MAAPSKKKGPPKINRSTKPKVNRASKPKIYVAPKKTVYHTPHATTPVQTSALPSNDFAQPEDDFFHNEPAVPPSLPKHSVVPVQSHDVVVPPNPSNHPVIPVRPHNASLHSSTPQAKPPIILPKQAVPVLPQAPSQAVNKGNPFVHRAAPKAPKRPSQPPQQSLQPVIKPKGPPTLPSRASQKNLPPIQPQRPSFAPKQSQVPAYKVPAYKRPTQRPTKKHKKYRFSFKNFMPTTTVVTSTGPSSSSNGPSRPPPMSIVSASPLQSSTMPSTAPRGTSPVIERRKFQRKNVSSSLSPSCPDTLDKVHKMIKYDEFTEIDLFATNAPEREGRFVDSLAKYIAQEATSPLDIGRAVYVWIARHIAYDLDLLQVVQRGGGHRDVIPLQVLRNRKTVCTGYANLFKALCDNLGVECHVVNGVAAASHELKNLGTAKHAWNAVKIDDCYYLLDATWGAGYVHEAEFEFKFDNFWFFTDPTLFVKSHFPNETKWQLLKEVVTQEEFDDMPVFMPLFFSSKARLLSHHSRNVAAEIGGLTEIVLAGPNAVSFTATISQIKTDDNGREIGTQRLPQNAVLSQRREPHSDEKDSLKQGEAITQFLFYVPGPGEFLVHLFAVETNDEGGSFHGELILEYLVWADGFDEPGLSEFPMLTGDFHKAKLTLISPLQKRLPKGSTQEFQISKGSGMSRVGVLQGKQLTELHLVNGTHFAGSVTIQQLGQVVIGSIGGDARSWSLKSLVAYNT